MTSPSTRRSDVTTARIGSIIKAMMLNNDNSELKVFITESQIRAAYQHVYGETVNFNLVKNYIESLGSTVEDHNQYKGLDTTTNLRLRGVKIREVYENIKQLITQDDL
jgi:UDP-N-acetylenolpyruvoylglucosamine reductase